MSKLCSDCACENVCKWAHTVEESCTDYKEDAINVLKKIESDIIVNSRPQWEKLVIDVYTCQMIIREEISKLQGGKQ